ncbi:MAG TPA: STAS domain-containing protein [Ramlibacter sp.]|jgi:ABC-type transporter Mla MlaB component|uniref:STAS domain-containing protein n=1 Tax=Ramlibacter sp. TaxID=1917967 RepID=UPI002D3F8D68|nr:STAS domain-containing protein [Ramlibacter sp.]HZY17672.1 STAS domain-containing protein [Ramlibacter sp.]
MATKDENGGLFSKVVKFVRNPTTGWSDLDQDSASESSYSKQMLKEMIERKRRNDFVRKREFDMLRKMRRSEVMAGQDAGARPSFFQSSLPSRPDDRASTLKKIDEIEAQMSMQWWKTKHGDASARSAAGSSTNFPMSAHMPPESLPRPNPSAPGAGANAYTRTAPQPLMPQDAGPTGRDSLPMIDFTDSDVTAPAPPPFSVAAPAPTPAPRRPDPAATARVAAPAPAAARPPAAAATPVTPAAVIPPAAAARQGPESTTPSGGFTASRALAIDVDDAFAHDPELEEAAIRFANGDDAGAEVGLMEVLGAGGTRIDHDETWLTLFDLYRATGQQERFETAAIEFAGRFGRSAPQWISLPEAVGRMGATKSGAPAAGGSGAIADWNCPSSVGTQTLAALNAALGRAQQPWRLSWVKLSSIDEPALEGLARLFGQWASQPAQLRFIGADRLESVLRNATPSGDKSVNPAWWKLRMEVLRVMHRPDEFELVALDYCVTYEVSPPSWESARCDYKPLQADGSAVANPTLIGEAFHDSVHSGLTTGYGDTQSPGGNSSQLMHVATVELAGQILGDASDAIDLLDGKLSGADLMVISCARLIRIDFTAAGNLLNWASARQSEGRQVQFVDVNRLVAAFFNVIGIAEHARVVARRD